MAIACAVDASVLLNLGGARGFDVLTDNVRYAWKITPIVRGEVRHPETRRALEVAIVDGKIELVEIDAASPVEMDAWAERSRGLDAGEAETIALALMRGWVVAIEDRKGQRVVREAGGRWINCANLLLDAIADGRLTMLEADEMFRRLSCYSGYERKGVKSLQQLREA